MQQVTKTSELIYIHNNQDRDQEPLQIRISNIAHVTIIKVDEESDQYSVEFKTNKQTFPTCCNLRRKDVREIYSFKAPTSEICKIIALHNSLKTRKFSLKTNGLKFHPSSGGCVA